MDNDTSDKSIKDYYYWGHAIHKLLWQDAVELLKKYGGEDQLRDDPQVIVKIMLGLYKKKLGG